MKIGYDGISASKNTNSNFWLILGLLLLEGSKPFEIGFYNKQSKPDTSEIIAAAFICKK
jgi:hypothetical protein